MLSFIDVLSDSISALMLNVSNTNRLSLSEYYGLMADVQNESLSESDKKSIGHTLRLIDKCRVSIVDDIAEFLGYPTMESKDVLVINNISECSIDFDSMRMSCKLFDLSLFPDSPNSNL